MTDQRSLQGRAVLVTGAGRGIGRSIALGLARAGADVCVSARTQTQLDAVVGAIESAGGRAISCAGDVTSREDVVRMVDATVQAFGSLDGLVNNAGILRSGSVVSMTEADWNAVFDTNLKGVFLGCQVAIERMSAVGAGKIVNVASTFGLSPVKNHAAYCASKAAILQFTRVAALEAARFGLQVNALAPGYVATDLNADSLADEGVRERILRRVPAGRIADPDDLVAAVEYLLSSGSDYVTGHTLVIDGGFGLT